MSRYIDADELLARLKSDALWKLLVRYNIEGAIEALPTADVIPVEFIEKQIESAEWILTHIGNSDYYGNTCEELSLKCYLLRSLINKWRDEE